MLIKKLIQSYKFQGLKGVRNSILNKVLPKTSSLLKLCEVYLNNCNGIEIGGRTPLFEESSILPIYQFPKNLDNCNFSNNTRWEGSILEGNTFDFKKGCNPGKQYICEASDLSNIEDNLYDFLISSHVIEHLANPIKGLMEWVRVIKENGTILLVIPHRDGSFDHKREVTTFEHLLKDYKQDVGEEDLTHLEEICALTDLTFEGVTQNEMRERSLKNFENRLFHHHVFDIPLVMELFNFLNLQIIGLEAIRPYHINILAVKIPSKEVADNSQFSSPTNNFQSFFKSDFKV